MDSCLEEILFTKNELVLIKESINNLLYKRSEVFFRDSKSEVSDYRKSEQQDIELSGQIKTLLLSKFNKFGIVDLPKHADILRYTIGDEFKKHTDNGYPQTHRYKTIIIQLSEPDNYTGGTLNVVCEGNKLIANKEIGNTIIFDSSLTHSVNVITSGIRYCLVMWLEKKHFGFVNTII